MVQIVVGILFLLPILILIHAISTKDVWTHFPDILLTSISGLLLSALTIFTLISWAFSGNKEIVRFHMMYSVFAVLIVMIVIPILTRKKFRVVWYFPFLQLLLSNLIVITFIIGIPLIQTQRENTYRQNTTALATIADRIIVYVVEKNVGDMTVLFSLNNVPPGGYTLATSTTITADTYTISKATCTLDQQSSFRYTDNNVRVSIPYSFIRTCLNRNKIAADNANIQGLIVTMNPRLITDKSEVNLSPVSIGKWIDITVSKKSIEATDKEGHTTTIRW